jgi:hypothetical protein
VEIIASGPGTFDGCGGYWHLRGGDQTQRRAVYILYQFSR